MGTPGPGQYDMTGYNSGKGVTLGAKYSPTKLNQ